MKGLECQEQVLFHKPIKKNMVNFFRQECIASDTKQKGLWADCNLFSQLFISCQSRQCNIHMLNEVFKYENQSVPAALSDNGTLHTCQKYHLLKSLNLK